MKFAVTILHPPGYQHWAVAQEIAETVHYGLIQLGHDSVLTPDRDLDDRQYIIFLPHWLPLHDVEVAPNSILYNLEQVYLNSPWFQPPMLDCLCQYQVWDYSAENIKQLRHWGLDHVQHVPIGYVPQLTRIAPVQNEDIDVLFYGSMNHRRHQILEALKSEGIQVQVLSSVYGQERDNWISRSKIVLNLHFYSAKVFEIARVSYLLANQRFVISERGGNFAEEQPFSDGVVFVDYDKLVETCLDFLQRSQDRQTIAAAGFNIMRQRAIADYLLPAVQALQPGRQVSIVQQRSYSTQLARQMHLAVVCLTYHQYDEAIALYEQILEFRPDFTLGYWNLGLALLLQGKDADAQLVWLTGLMHAELVEPPQKNASELVQILHQAAFQQLEDQNTDSAIRIYHQILEFDATNFPACLKLGQLLAIQGQIEAADQYLREAMALQPDSHEVALALETLREAG